MSRHIVSLTVLASIISAMSGSASADGLEGDDNRLSVAEIMADMQSLDGPTLGGPALGDCEDEEMVDLYLEANQDYFQEIQGVITRARSWMPSF